MERGCIAEVYKDVGFPGCVVSVDYMEIVGKMPAPGERAVPQIQIWENGYYSSGGMVRSRPVCVELVRRQAWDEK